MIVLVIQTGINNFTFNIMRQLVFTTNSGHSIKDNCLSFDFINSYVQGKFNTEDQYKIERHLTDCELCSDALEGYATTNLDQAKAILEDVIWPRKVKKVSKKSVKVIAMNTRPL